MIVKMISIDYERLTTFSIPILLIHFREFVHCESLKIAFINISLHKIYKTQDEHK